MVAYTQLNKQQLADLNAVVEPRTGDPGSPVAGQVWYRTDLKQLSLYDGTTQQRYLFSGGVVNADINAAAAIARSKLDFGSGLVNADIATGAAIAEAKLTLATDAAAGTGSRRTLGTGSTQAMPGNQTLDAITAPAGDVSMNSHKLTNLAAPVSANDAVRLTDLQAAQAGIDGKPSVRILATTNIGLSGLSAIDGVTPIAGDRVLAAGQTTASANGPYIAASGAWSRATDSVNPNSMWFVEEGTTNHDTQWWVTTDGAITLGTTSLVISQFSGTTTISGTAARITVAGTTIDIASTYVGQASITTLGTITTGVWNGTAIAVANGGTGSTSAGAARTALNTPQRGAQVAVPTLVAGTENSVAHGLGSVEMVLQCIKVSDKSVVQIGLRYDGTNVYITADIAVTSGTLLVNCVPLS